ncbi:MAG: hypothetical protein MHMPM18_004203 [Marteilia pararefringens]
MTVISMLDLNFHSPSQLSNSSPEEGELVSLRRSPEPPVYESPAIGQEHELHCCDTGALEAGSNLGSE